MNLEIVIPLAAAVALILLVFVYSWYVRFSAIRDGFQEKSLYFGLVRLLLWEPNEGLITLKNKQFCSVVPKPDQQLEKQGGTMLIWPVLGEEAATRQSLAIRMTTWADDNILSRESIRCRMKVAVFWRVRDLFTYYFSINRDVHVDGRHSEKGLGDAADTWVKAITESTLRTLSSNASIAFLVSSKATGYLHVANKHDTPPPQTPLLQNPGSEASARRRCWRRAKRRGNEPDSNFEIKSLLCQLQGRDCLKRKPPA